LQLNTSLIIVVVTLMELVSPFQNHPIKCLDSNLMMCCVFYDVAHDLWLRMVYMY